MDVFREKCLKILPEFGAFDNAEIFLNELLQYNQKVNLISRVSDEKMVEGHFIDCFMAIPHFLEMADAFSFKNDRPVEIVDVGTGGGFPGIVLALAMPNVFVKAVESKKKKIDFLLYIAEKIRLKNFSVEHNDISVWKPKQSYCIITARAFASLVKIVRQTWHLLDQDGGYLLYKGKDLKVNEEIEELLGNQAVKKHLSSKKIFKIFLKNPFVEVERCLVKIQ